MRGSIRHLLIGFGAVVAVGTATLQDSVAAEPHAYCIQGGRGSTGGMLMCSYDTWEQCLASIGGGDESCSRNPEIGWRAIEAGRRGVAPRSPRPRASGY
jgi:Protein of unknown function (DUF3551)